MPPATPITEIEKWLLFPLLATFSNRMPTIAASKIPSRTPAAEHNAIILPISVNNALASLLFPAPSARKIPVSLLLYLKNRLAA